MTLRIENALSDSVRVAWFALAGIHVAPFDPALETAIAERAAYLRILYAEQSSASEVLAPARRLYHGLGMDPSKHRPSSEALLRRIFLGKGLFRVNTAVDAANLTSIHHFRPVGLYDADRIVPNRDSGRGNVTLRLGLEGEEYPGIGKEMIHLLGRPALVDEVGPFGNPSSDSDRTKITLTTTRLWFVLFEPSGEDESVIEEHLDLSRRIMIARVGGEVE